MSRVDRLNDDSDSGGCVQCGECCMVLTLESMTDDEAERVGKSNCYPVQELLSTETEFDGINSVVQPDKWGLVKIDQDWLPEYAYEGACSFLEPKDKEGGGYRCSNYNCRPSFCKKFKCVCEYWAPIMEYRVLEFKLYVDRPNLTDDELQERESELQLAYDLKERMLSKYQREG